MKITFTDIALARWNAVVGKRWQYRETTATHHIFLHPTKGYRKVSLMRLPLA